MIIDLNTLFDKVDIDTSFNYDKEFISNTDIVELNNVLVKGYVKPLDYAGIKVFIEASGIMKLKDSLTLELIDYPFNIVIDNIIDENCEDLAFNLEKDQNLLDIKEILWQNIVLEVPIRIVKESNKKKSLKGEGWELLDKEEKNNNNRLAPLRELLDKKEV